MVEAEKDKEESEPVLKKAGGETTVRDETAVENRVKSDGRRRPWDLPLSDDGRSTLTWELATDKREADVRSRR